MKIELAHDSLAAKIYDKVSLEEKTRRKVERFIFDRYAFYQSRDVLLNNEELDYIKPYLDKIDITPDQKAFVNKSRAVVLRRRRILAAIVTAVFLAISGLAIYSFLQRNEALEQSKIAQASEAKAQQSLEEAQRQERLALEQKAEAENQRKIAEEQAEIARNASSLAEERRLQALATAAAERLARAEAIEAKNAADSARAVAVLAQSAEEEQRAAAEAAQQQAEAKEREARQLLMISIAQSMAARSLQLDEAGLKARIAQQAYTFNRENGGNPYDRTIYEGLYYAAKELEGPDFNQLKGHKSAISTISFDQNGQHVLANGTDGKLLRWKWGEANTDSLVLNRIVKRTQAISPDGQWMAIGLDRKPYLQIATLKQSSSGPQTISGFESKPRDMVFMPDGSGFLILGADHNIHRYTMANQQLQLVAKSPKPLRAIAVSPTSKKLAGISQDGALMSWDLGNSIDETPEIIVQKSGSDFYALTYNRSGNRLAVGENNGQVYIYDMNNNREIAQLRGHSARISGLKFSHSDEYLATASYDGSVQLWVVGRDDYQTRLPIILRDHNSWVMSLAFSPDDKSLLTGGRNGLIRIWPTRTEDLASNMCAQIDQNFTVQEWNLYVGKDIDRVQTCTHLPLP